MSYAQAASTAKADNDSSLSCRVNSLKIDGDPLSEEDQSASSKDDAMRLNQLEFWSPAAENSWEMPISESSFEVFVDPDSLRLARVAEAIEALTEQDDSHAIVLDGQECRVLTATCVADGQQFPGRQGLQKTCLGCNALPPAEALRKCLRPVRRFH